MNRENVLLKRLRYAKMLLVAGVILLLSTYSLACYYAYEDGKHKRQAEDMCGLYNKVVAITNSLVDTYVNPYLESKNYTCRITQKLSQFEDCRDIG